MGSSEWTKVFALLAHYQEHCEESDIDFISFLDLHYGWDENAQKHDKEDPHEGTLPFHGSHIPVFASYTLPNPEIPQLGLFLPLFEVPVFPLSIGIPLGYSKENFQPPQFSA